MVVDPNEASTPSEPAKSRHRRVDYPGFLATIAIIIVLVMGAITLASVTAMGRVLDQVNVVVGNQDEQAALSACRGRISQEIQEEFRLNVGDLIKYSNDGDTARAAATLERMRSIKPYAQRIVSECNADPQTGTLITTTEDK